jgi:TRAP-type mannitol/chloroaromatic compound transport system substrate-binding protein
MMQRLPKTGVRFGFLLMIILTGLVLVFSSNSALAQNQPQVIKWRMQSVDPPSLIGPQITQKAFCENIKKMSNGRLEITLFTAGQLSPTLELVDSLAKGTVDIAYSSSVYYTGIVPEASIDLVSLPPNMLKTLQDALQVYWYMGVDDLIREGYKQHGVYYVGSLFFTEPNTFWSKKPIKGVDDLKGFKIRGYGYYAKTLAKLGASPTFIPHEEVYTALAQGVIDGSMTAGSYYKRFKYYEVAPYYYLPGFAPVWSMCIMASQKSWNALPNDLKAIVQEAFKVFAIDHQQRTWWEHEQMLQELSKLNATLITWPDSEVTKMRDAGMTFIPEIANKSERCAKGIEIIQSYMKTQGYIK